MVEKSTKQSKAEELIKALEETLEIVIAVVDMTELEIIQNVKGNRN